jgi:high-affinity nickel-transport protein
MTGERRVTSGNGRAIGLVAGLAAANIVIWALAWGGAHRYAALLSTGLLAYGFGLRHAVDPDHIAAIDNTTRRLMSLGKRPVSVGLFFGLGHSTVVVLLCLVLAVFAQYAEVHLHQWRTIGSVVGSTVSTVFLFVIGAINTYVFVDLLRRSRTSDETDAAAVDALSEQRGFLARLLLPALRLVRHGWQMYFVGFLFGLGFDTATEVGVLTLSAQSGQTGMPMSCVLLLPLLFTAGMCLIDTLDGILMLRAYGWAAVSPRRRLGYNIAITGLSILVAFAVGAGQLAQSFAPHSWLSGKLEAFADSPHYYLLGVGIVGLFAGVWFLAAVLQRTRPGYSR